MGIMKLKLLLIILGILFASANLFSQEDYFILDEDPSDGFFYKDKDNNMIDVREGITIMKSPSKNQSTGVCLKIKNKKFMFFNLSIFFPFYMESYIGFDGKERSIPRSIFMIPQSDVALIPISNEKNVMELNIEEDFADIVQEGDEVLVIGNHSGNGAIEKKWTCIKSIGADEFILMGRNELRNYVNSKMNLLYAKRSDLSIKLTEAYNSANKNDIKELEANMTEIKKSLNFLTYQSREISLRGREGFLFSYSSLGSLVIHLKTGKCIGIFSGDYFLDLSGNASYSVEEDFMSFGNFSFRFRVLRSDRIKKMLRVGYVDYINLFKNLREAFSVFQYIDAFVSTNSYGSEKFNFPSSFGVKAMHNGNSTSFFISSGRGFDSLLSSRNSYERLFSLKNEYENDLKNSNTTTSNAVARKFLIEGMRSILGSMRSRISNSRVYKIFSNDIGQFVQYMEAKEKDLNMYKKHL